MAGVPSSPAAAGHVCAAPEPEAAGRRRGVVPDGLVRPETWPWLVFFESGTQLLVTTPVRTCVGGFGLLGVGLLGGGETASAVRPCFILAVCC